MMLIDVSTRRYPDTHAIVDNEDYDWVSKYNWYAFKSGGTLYAVRDEWHPPKKKHFRMHREIMAAVNPFMVDHADGNGLNNQKSNLRLCSKAQNAWNSKKRLDGKTSRFRGVCFNKKRKKFVVQIVCHGKHYNFGFYKQETDAALAYNEAAISLYGKFARLNEIPA